MESGIEKNQSFDEFPIAGIPILSTFRAKIIQK